MAARTRGGRGGGLEDTPSEPESSEKKDEEE
jgi:hypothetical protein